MEEGKKKRKKRKNEREIDIAELSSAQKPLRSSEILLIIPNNAVQDSTSAYLISVRERAFGQLGVD